ncbi:histidine kinase [Azohydromonas lata]|uniref:Histidine kinase n=1 Tax=Azohydromonas lata TaxID=45677 RepID=A0ABU5IQK3_9BURK|nr:histidine kinase [Azohydromonas lata]MDZ5461160.1 histidine kinase [Azohydromonas lata]
MQALYAHPEALPPGEIPDLKSAAAPLPMDLPRLVMRRALAVALGALLLSLVLGLLRAREDTRREMEGSLSLVQVAATLAGIAAQDDATALAALRALPGLRHVRLVVQDAAGRPLPGLDGLESPSAGWLEGIAGLLGLEAAEATVSWRVPRPGGSHWTVRLSAWPDSELREALGTLGGSFALLSLCCALMLVVMRWNVRRAFGPLQSLLAAIAGVQRQDVAGVRALSPMPIRELEAISRALKQLVAAQEQSEGARRVLALRVLSLREDERQRLARDLHDEFGQRLTALRVDASWLTRRLSELPALQSVAAGMGEQVARVQDDVRKLLARLRPQAVAAAGLDGEADAPPTLGRLRQLLQELLDGWCASPAGESRRYELALDGAVDELPLPPDLVMGLYRISQEALTNVARHAGATRVQLALCVTGGAGMGEPLRVDWSVEDDGRGLDDLQAALQRGSGLAGIKERVWALGGELEAGAAAQGEAAGTGPGLRLQARFAIENVAAEVQP